MEEQGRKLRNKWAVALRRIGVPVAHEIIEAGRRILGMKIQIGDGLPPPWIGKEQGKYRLGHQIVSF